MTNDTFGIPDGLIESCPVDFRPHNEQEAILRQVLADVGVQLGAYDERIVAWLAMWDWPTFAVITSWIKRAGQGGPR